MFSVPIRSEVRRALSSSGGLYYNLTRLPEPVGEHFRGVRKLAQTPTLKAFSPMGMTPKGVYSLHSWLRVDSDSLAWRP